MALFDSIINGASEKFGLGDKAGGILSALLALMTNQDSGGFSGFINRFREAGLGDTVTSWITSGDNTELSNEQMESAIGGDTIANIAEQAGVSQDQATSALAYMTPRVVDSLTPDGEIPDEASLLSKVGGFLSGLGLGAVGAVGAMASGAADKAGDAVDAAKNVAGAAADKVGDVAGAVGDTAGAAVDKGKEVIGDAAGAVGNVAGAAADKVGSAFNSVGDAFDGDGDGGSILKWLLPLLLLGLLLVLGFMFCGRGNTETTTTNTNTEENVNAGGNTTTAEAVDSSVNIEAKDGKYIITGVVKDEDTKNKIKAEAEKVWGAGNVDVEGLKVDANAKPFKDGWWNSFAALLPDLKDWKTGTINWTGDAIKTVGEIPAAIADKLKSLFSGWTMAGATDAVTGAARELTELAFGDTKLQAYPGGIEDQLIKFIESDEYKNATEEDLKKKWFNFDDLNFKFGTTELEASSKRQLDNIVAILKANPEVKIKIGGYTDKKGDDAKNKKLSQDRANAVKAALDKADVGGQVNSAEGYGEEQATVPETASDEERAKDRKTAIRLTKGGESSAAADANKAADANAEKKE